MDNSNQNTPRKSHDINNQIEEDALWELEDDWEDVEEAVADDTNDETPDSHQDELEDQPLTTEQAATEEEEEVQEASEEEPPVQPETQEDDQVDHAEEVPLDSEDREDIPEEETETQQETEAAQIEEAAPAENDLAENQDSDSEAPAVEQDEPSEARTKLSLNSTEKITLAAMAALFLGLAVWGYVWLRGKNEDANTKAALELPVTGKHATITEFGTFWKPAGKAPGIKLGAVVVPAASITLGKESESGALRIFFRNAAGESIGDTITIRFTSGKFENGKESIEVSASDGFHLKGDFHAYQMDESLAWKVHVLEADSDSGAGSSYQKLLETQVEPKMR